MTEEFLPVPPGPDYRAAHRDATRRVLIDEVRNHSRSPRRLTIAAVAAVGVILVGTGTAVAYQLASSAPVTDKSTARCYSVASTNFGKDFPGTTVAAVANSSASEPGTVTAPVDLCRYLWSIGAVAVDGPGVTTSNSPRTDIAIPPLVGCVLPDGTAGVFPGTEQTCQELGLPVAQSG